MPEGYERLGRRTVLKTIGAAGVVGTTSGVVAADEEREHLRRLRRGAARYHDLAKAEADGYVLDEDHCVAHPEGDGAMGFHAGKQGLVDENLSPEDPEILVYERKDDNYVLVAAEFVSTAPRDGPPPELFGHHFHEFPDPRAPFNWALHVWAWKNNPNGTFADFNPRVSCPEPEE